MMKYTSTLFLACILCLSSVLTGQEGTPEIIRGDEKFKLLVKVVDKDSRAPTKNTDVYLYKTKKDQLVSEQSTVNGLAEFSIDPFTEYEVRTCDPQYLKNGMSIYECNEGNEVLCTFGAADYVFVAAGGKDKPIAYLKATIELQRATVGSIFELENVYYDLDKASLRPTGKRELDEVVAIMKRNKSITIELSSHTDSRASDAYNDDLSLQRAKSCFDYLVAKGISANRVIPSGYGEQRLRNECADGVECTETQHQKNRRTEIEILTYEEIDCAPSIEVDFRDKDLKIDPDDVR